MRYVHSLRVACLSFVFQTRRLAMPQEEHGFKGTPRLNECVRAFIFGIQKVAVWLTFVQL